MTIQIREVRLYVGLTEDAAECYQAKKFLEKAGIPVELMLYIDETAIKETLDAMSGWKWGEKSDQDLSITRLPVLTWRVLYSEFKEPTNHAVVGLEAIRTCELLSQKQFIAVSAASNA